MVPVFMAQLKHWAMQSRASKALWPADQDFGVTKGYGCATLMVETSKASMAVFGKPA